VELEFMKRVFMKYLNGESNCASIKELFEIYGFGKLLELNSGLF
jgi:hypothetical protein